ncbi:MobA/MobL family protein [Oceanivirga miroungae]|uniref:MobA/MobL protein n=1 Tax=Oceanivirga miroungae TaxID=1130046 RepID=A0A6I8M6F9_9FUSO|nr:MobA/MobL family protein [Oceanivirga miroungae]VWL84953.1 MobA/MobL protein [Oceanivirga miroungae]
MAIYRLHLKNGYTPISHLSYINRKEKYSARKDLVSIGEGNLPTEFKNIEHFWESAVKNKRANARIYKEFEISLPKEFSDKENIELTEKFTRMVFKNKFVYNYAIHNPKGIQPHAHIMFCDRELDGIKRNENMFFVRHNSKNPMLGGVKKNRFINTNNYLLEIRKLWEDILNEKLLEKGLDVVSCKTLEEQKEEAIKNKDYEKAKTFNRNPRKKINIRDKSKKELYDELKESKDISEERYKVVNKIRILRLIDENIKQGYKDFESLISKKEKILNEIEKLDKKSKSNRLVKIAYNQVSKGEYFKLLNERKKENKVKLKAIENEYNVDKLVLSMRVKYLKKINEEKENLKIIEASLIALEKKMEDKPIYSLEKLYYKTKKSKNINKLKEINKMDQRNQKINLKRIMYDIKRLERIKSKENNYLPEGYIDLDEYRYINLDDNFSVDLEL